MESNAIKKILPTIGDAIVVNEMGGQVRGFVTGFGKKDGRKTVEYEPGSRPATGVLGSKWCRFEDVLEVYPDQDTAIQRSIDRFKVECINAGNKGLVLLPSVDGPYAFDPVANGVVGRKGSDEYCMAVSDQPQSMTKEKFLELQSAAESLDMDHAQGRVLPGHYERIQQISALMDASPWTLHPDYGCILRSDVDELDRQAMAPRG